MTSLGSTLDVPDELVGKIPCQDPAYRELFWSLDLDVETDDPEFLSLSPAEQEQALQRKTEAENQAIAACQRCPLLNECRDWACVTDVYGIAGGLTGEQRTHMAGGRSPESSSRNTYSAVPATPETSNRRRLKFDSVSPESLVLYDALALSNGTPVPRNTVVTLIAEKVDRDVARRWGESLPCPEEKKTERGAMKFARNRVDIALKRGRIVKVENETGDVCFVLPDNVARDYRTWKK